MNIIWFRRNLRLHDNVPLKAAISQGKEILPIFIFDPKMLAKFSDSFDRRVNFIAAALFSMHEQLKALGAGLQILFGAPQEVLPKLILQLEKRGITLEHIYADEDFEPHNIVSDAKLKAAIKPKLELFCDHLLVRPSRILTGQGGYFKVFTPFSKSIKQYLADNKVRLAEYELSDAKFHKLPEDGCADFSCRFDSIEDILDFIGYKYRGLDSLWPLDNVRGRLKAFVAEKLKDYKQERDFLSRDGTSVLSPYLRFGLISIRECFLATYDQPNSDMWINELLWREFYANILVGFPHTIDTELNSLYAGKIPWRRDSKMAILLEEGKTGFPIVDSAMRQLVQDGWMHNRSRMIVASFATKNMLLDWRLGEQLFAKYLMDYDLASNVGGWQWASSCGTDAQPYFRIFNPTLQSLKFDPEGIYIKKYVPELRQVSKEHIHENALIKQFYPEIDYPPAIVDYSQTRRDAIDIFRKI